MTDQSDIPSLQLQVLKSIRAELGGLRAEVGGLRAEVGGLREGLAEVRTEMHEGFTRLRSELVGLRGDMDVGFTAVRLQNDRRFLDHERRLRELELNAGK